MIFKRKSFHLFKGVGEEHISDSDLAEIETAFSSFESLCPDIHTEIKIVPSLKRDAEYCILIFSEKKDNYLMNAGYLGEQLDLFLVKRGIGTLWYGLGKNGEESPDGMDFVIMLAIRKVSDEAKFRKDMFKSKRKPLEEIWVGDTLGIAEIARFSPSACNSQPWHVNNDGGAITVSRYKKPGRVGIMSQEKAFYYNRIDMGIFLCILEICMAEKGIEASRVLFVDGEDIELSRVAQYTL